MNITIVGTGYVGLVTGVCFAEMGNSVTCVDIDENKIEKLKRGESPIYEQRLDDLLAGNLKADRLQFTKSLKNGVKDAEVIFLALPTPPAEDGSADLRYVLEVAGNIGKTLDHYAVIVNKSTVPVGTSERVKKAIKSNTSVAFDIVSNPEFLREGLAIYDFLNPDRIILGVENDKSKKIMLELYKPVSDKGSKIYVMDMKSAEITKYASNAFLATKISFMNEIANICEVVGANVDQVRLGVGSDTRIGDKSLYPGIGYGGSCFPKDVKALRKTAAKHGYRFNILDSVTEVNEIQKQIIVGKIRDYFSKNLDGKKFAIWGVAFKPETDDIREAASLEIIDSLLAEGAEVSVYDPQALENAEQYFKGRKNLTFADNQYTPLDGADALIVATEWDVFREPDLGKVKQLLSSPVIFDGRNIYEPETMESLGFDYLSIGRRQVVR